MRWRRGVGSDQVEDRRGQGRRMGMPVLAGGGGIGALVILVLTLFAGGGGGGFEIDPGTSGMPPMSGAPRSPDAPDPDADLKEFVGFVVDDVQDAWERQFAAAGKQYQQTTLVLFEQATETGCGTGTTQTGPFYCPLDSKVYIDLEFFRELGSRYGAPGDFAQAYVIAHEFGHHVQNVLGTSERVRRAQQRDPDEANELSVRLELQADCLAGVWGSTAEGEGLLERGDLEEGLEAAAAVGDDRLQRKATGQVNPETWTHGSSAQRQKWFRRGFDSGDPDRCDAFSGNV